MCPYLGHHLLNRCLQMFVLKLTADKQGSDNNRPRPAKCKQDQTRATKGTASINLQAPHAETNHETPSPKTEGAAVSRRMASSIIRLVFVSFLYHTAIIHSSTMGNEFNLHSTRGDDRRFRPAGVHGSARPALTKARPRHSSTPGTLRTLQISH